MFILLKLKKEETLNLLASLKTTNKKVNSELN